MSDRPWWKRAPKKSPDDMVVDAVKDLESRGRAVRYFGRRERRDRISGTPRSVIFTRKMKVPKKKRVR